jgi:hypothetical protein
MTPTLEQRNDGSFMVRHPVEARIVFSRNSAKQAWGALISVDVAESSSQYVKWHMVRATRPTAYLGAKEQSRWRVRCRAFSESIKRVQEFVPGL